MALKFAMILQAVDRMSGPAKRAKAGADHLVKGAREIARNAPGAARAMDGMTRAASRIPARLRLARMQVKALAGRAGMKGLELAARGAGWAIGTLIGKTIRLAAGLARLGIAGAALGSGALFGGSIRIGASFEDMEVRLARLVGSAGEARRQLRWLVDQRLPVPIEQLGEAFVQAKKAGIDVTTASLKALVDESIASKKELVDLIGAIKEAKNGDFDALDPFDIQTSRKNGRVMFQWIDQAGKRMTKNVRDDARQIERALVDIFGQRSKGAAEDYASTFKGLLGGLGIWWQRFQLKVADAGIFEKLKSKLQAVTDWLEKKLEDGSINRWAETVSKKLEEIVNWAAQFTEKDWERFGSDLWNIAKAVWSIAKGFASAVNWVSRLINTQDQLAKNSGKVTVNGGPFFKIRSVNDAPPPPRPPKAPPMSIRTPRGPGSPIGIRGTPINPRASTAAPQKVAVGGSMTVEVKPPAGWSARPTRLSSANGDVPLVYRGGAMAGRG